MFRRSNHILLTLLLFTCLALPCGLANSTAERQVENSTEVITSQPVLIPIPVAQEDATLPTTKADRNLPPECCDPGEISYIQIDLEVKSAGISWLDPAQSTLEPELAGPSDGKLLLLENSLQITNKSSLRCQDLQLQVPLMADIDSPYQELVDEKFSIPPSEIRENDDNNRLGTFSFAELMPGASTILTQRYVVRVEEADWIHTGEAKQLKDPQLYLAAAPKIEADAPEIRAVADQIAAQAQAKDSLTVAREAFEFAHQALIYDNQAPSANRGALAGLQAKAGVCEEFASLFVATCRASGVPARIVNGYANDVRELAPAHEPTSLSGRRHQWAEFYLDGKGWIPADPTLYSGTNPVFGELPAGYYVAQNYGDVPIRGYYKGGKVDIGLQDQICPTGS